MRSLAPAPAIAWCSVHLRGRQMVCVGRGLCPSCPPSCQRYLGNEAGQNPRHEERPRVSERTPCCQKSRVIIAFPVPLPLRPRARAVPMALLTAAGSACRELLPAVLPAPRPHGVPFTFLCPFPAARSETPNPSTFPFPRCQPRHPMPARTSQRRGQGAIAPHSGSLALTSITRAPRQGSCSSPPPWTQPVSSLLQAPKGGKTFWESPVGSRKGLWEKNWSLSLCSAPDPLTARSCSAPSRSPAMPGCLPPVPSTGTAWETQGEEGPESTSSRPRCHPLCSRAAPPWGAPQAGPRTGQDPDPGPVFRLLSVLWLKSPNPAAGGTAGSLCQGGRAQQCPAACS